MAFSASDAAFEGFRLVRRNPLALVAWALVYAVLSLGALVAVAGIVEPLIEWSERAEALESSNPTPAEFGAMFQAFGQIFLQISWLIPISLFVSAVLAAAVARGVLNPKAKGFGYLRCGMDEVRVTAVTFVLGLLMTLLCVAVVMVIGMIGGFSTASGANWGWLIALAAGLGGFGLVIWLAVRLSLAVPITVAENRMAFFDSFAVTKGRFWPLLGMAIIAGVMTLIISFLSSIITMPLGMMSGMEGMNFGPNSDPELLRAALDISNPWVIASSLVEAIVYALTVGVMYAPFAAAYRDIKGLGAETPTA
jgi:hypothetical protein